MAEEIAHKGVRRREKEGPTDKMREYLEVIYYLSARNEPVISARLAEWMGVTAPTVTDIVRRMERAEYIVRDSRGEISLTPTGFVLAEAMVKRHRLLERFLVDVMGIPWHQIHEEAVRLEAALSPTMEARIAALVGDSTTCPHGNPIPGSGGTYGGSMRLDRASSGQEVVLHRITEEAEEDSNLMRQFQESGIVPGAKFQVIGNSTTYGVTLQAEGRTITLSPQIAASLWAEVS